MHFDALTLACVAAELKSQLVPGRIQQTLLPDEQSIGLEIYAGGRRRYLYLSAHQENSRVTLTEVKLRRGVETETPLLLMVRKYVRDSILLAVEQPDPFERVLWLRFEHRQHGATALVVEPIGRMANILLVKGNGHILECLRRVPPGERARRVLLPGRPYAPPPKQERLPPLDDGRPDYYERLAAILATDLPLWRALSAHVAGVSPSLGREITWRATGKSEATADSATVLATAQAMQELWAPLRTGEWQPGVWRSNEEVVGFSPYHAHVAGAFERTETMSEAIERYVAGQAERRQPTALSSENAPDAYAVQRRTVESLLRKAQKRLEQQLAALAGDEPAPGAAEKLRAAAGWLLALQTQIQPGETILAVALGDETLTISLDPGLTPVEQAQRMYKQAAKMERAANFIPQRRERLRRDLEFLAQLEHDLRQARNQPEIAAVRFELENAGLSPMSRPTGEKGRRSASNQGRKAPRGAAPLIFVGPDGLEILVGRNAQENELVTFTLAQANDLWLHARDAAGAHVVVRSRGRAASEATLQLAAQLAAYHSERRGENAVDVIMAWRKDVSRVPGGRAGQVIVRREEVVRAPGQAPDAPQRST